MNKKKEDQLKKTGKTNRPISKMTEVKNIF